MRAAGAAEQMRTATQHPIWSDTKHDGRSHPSACSIINTQHRTELHHVYVIIRDSHTHTDRTILETTTQDTVRNTSNYTLLDYTALHNSSVYDHLPICRTRLMLSLDSHRRCRSLWNSFHAP